MKCETTDLEIETLLNRIANGDIDLQPDFQRGEIWAENKKRKLIDSILRGWKIPPIHVINSSKAIDEVLDGQQRLVTIKDFHDNRFKINGNLEPQDEEIKKLDGLYYEDLDKIYKRRFRQYSIVIIRLTEYKPEEPAELFYRLNQPTMLTSAEQRNAYMGIPREQIKKLSGEFIYLGARKETIGFSNSRLAYEEIISKLCYVLEIKTLKKKVTSNDLSDKYRKGIPFPMDCINITQEIIKKFMDTISCELIRYNKINFTKSTIFSWFIFICRNLDIDKHALEKLIFNFESCRVLVKQKKISSYIVNDSDIKSNIIMERVPFFEIMFNTFNQRASMGSTDALSIIYRDIIINIFKDAMMNPESKLLKSAISEFKKNGKFNYVLENIYIKLNWGENFK